MMKFTLLALVVVLLAVAECHPPGRGGGRGRGGRGGGGGGRGFFRWPSWHSWSDSSSSDEYDSSEDSSTDSSFDPWREDTAEEEAEPDCDDEEEREDEFDWEDEQMFVTDQPTEWLEDDDDRWLGGLSTPSEQQREEVPIEPYNNLMSKFFEREERRSDIRRNLIIGGTVIGVSILLLFIMLIACIVKKRMPAKQPCTMKEPEKSPYYYTPEPAQTIEKKPLGDGVTYENSDSYHKGADNPTYVDPALPSYSSLDLRRNDPVPIYDISTASEVPEVHHM